MDIVEEFDKFKKDLKEKWLDYYEENQESLNNWYKNSSIDNDFIFGVLTVIEPKVKTWISFYCTHCFDIYMHLSLNDCIQFLGLNFNYDEALEMRREERAKNQLIPSPSPLDDFRQKNQQLNNQS